MNGAKRPERSLSIINFKTASGPSYELNLQIKNNYRIFALETKTYTTPD